MPRQDNESDLARLRQMLDFAQKAVAFNKKRSRADLDSDEMLAMATVHLIELVGEASRTVSEGFQERYSAVPWRTVIGTRNRFVHGYVDVDLDIIWTIVQKDLPVLIRNIKKILNAEK